MDFNVISRLESHSKDLFKLQGRRLGSIREERDSKDEDDVGPALTPTGSMEDGFTSGEERTTGSALEREEAALRRREEKRAAWISQQGKEHGKQSQVGAEVGPKQSSETGKAAKKRKRHYEDLFAALTRNMGKGFLLGFGGKVFVNGLYPLLNLLRGRPLGLSRDALLLDAKEYGLFMGSLLSLYNTSMYESKKYVQYVEFLKKYRAMIAGAIAGTSLIWVPKDKRWPIVLFVVVRAFEIQVKLLANRKLVPTLPNSDVLLMCVSSMIMLHNWMYNPRTLDPAYSAFLTKHSQVHSVVRKGLADQQVGLPIDFAAINEIRAKKGLHLELATPLSNGVDYDKWAPGELLHPGKGMLRYFLKFFYNAMKNSIPVYLPVFAMPIVLFYPGVLIKRPVDTLQRVLKGVLRSSVFLSLYCAGGITTITLLRSIGMTFANMGTYSQLVFPLAGFVGGSATLLEKKSRRIELALYVMSKAVEGRWNQAVRDKLVTPFQDGDVLVFMYCLAIIMHAYQKHAGKLRDTYKALISKFFDSDERHVFYSMPRVVSEQLLSFGSRRDLSQRVISTIKKAQADAIEEHERQE